MANAALVDVLDRRDQLFYDEVDLVVSLQGIAVALICLKLGLSPEARLILEHLPLDVIHFVFFYVAIFLVLSLELFDVLVKSNAGVLILILRLLILLQLGLLHLCVLRDNIEGSFDLIYSYSQVHFDVGMPQIFQYLHLVEECLDLPLVLDLALSQSDIESIEPLSKQVALAVVHVLAEHLDLVDVNPKIVHIPNLLDHVLEPHLKVHLIIMVL